MIIAALNVLIDRALELDGPGWVQLIVVLSLCVYLMRSAFRGSL